MCSHSRHWVALGALKALPVEVVIGAAESGCESGDRGFLVSSVYTRALMCPLPLPLSSRAGTRCTISSKRECLL